MEHNNPANKDAYDNDEVVLIGRIATMLADLNKKLELKGLQMRLRTVELERVQGWPIVRREIDEKEEIWH